ncbi:MAG TPA: NAD(P)-dependent oxidoreductase [Vitreimonas sp.]|uniref:NAD-dependent epimerase/dehydratase family protein n=1 Tax=Vitreimonas sp. TaxID=3069702 RepID=UPI002D3306E5|nr:NAD(P)-dependent oxidoreductase [Vitreimonas sp.]HYD88079.1 NAD(P)-dependent oxidoreductase [Vitreimonas sp.]
MQVLVTGATGFLGGALSRRLLSGGEHVVAVGRDAAKLAALRASGAVVFSVDLAAPGDFTPPPCDAVVHCAALSAPWGARAAFERANVLATEQVLSLARRAGARRFVHISTPSVYFRFRDQIGVREDAALPQPVNLYAETKRRAEQLTLRAADLDPIVLRPRGLYGAGDSALLPRLLRAAADRPLPLMNGGRAETDLTHVDDVVSATIAALRAPPDLPQRIFNVSGGAPLRIRDVVEAAGARAGIDVRWRKAPVSVVLSYARAMEAACRLAPGAPEPPITAYGAGLFAFTQTLDISAAARLLHWRPQISFEAGLARTFAAAA